MPKRLIFAAFVSLSARDHVMFHSWFFMFFFLIYGKPKNLFLHPKINFLSFFIHFEEPDKYPEPGVYLKYILILLKFVVTILFTILISHHSLHHHHHHRSGLETRLYNHVRVNCSTSRHKTTAVTGGRGGGWGGVRAGGADLNRERLGGQVEMEG